jgi:hypothetical protein
MDGKGNGTHFLQAARFGIWTDKDLLIIARQNNLVLYLLVHILNIIVLLNEYRTRQI